MNMLAIVNGSKLCAELFLDRDSCFLQYAWKDATIHDKRMHDTCALKGKLFADINKRKSLLSREKLLGER